MSTGLMGQRPCLALGPIHEMANSLEPFCDVHTTGSLARRSRLSRGSWNADWKMKTLS